MSTWHPALPYSLVQFPKNWLNLRAVPHPHFLCTCVLILKGCVVSKAWSWQGLPCSAWVHAQQNSYLRAISEHTHKLYSLFIQ